MSVELSIVVPDDVAAQVALRLQQRYPDVVKDATSPADAMRRVVGWWTANLLADSAAQDVLDAAQSQITKLQKEMNQKAADVRTAAWDAIRDVLAAQPDHPDVPAPTSTDVPS